MGGKGIGFIASCLAIGAVVFATPAGAETFANGTPIVTPASGTANPYPSTISVAGMPGTIVKVRVTLNNILAPARELDVLLGGPGGSTILISDSCSAGGFIVDFLGRTFTFDDDAPSAIPETCTSAPQSGTYKPSNYDTADNFPGVPPPYPLGLSNFRGISPNGLWQLYVVDDANPDSSAVNGGWSLDLTTVAAAKRKKCKKKKHRAAAAKRCTRKPGTGKKNRR